MITPGRKKIENVPPRSQIALALHIEDRLFDTLLTATSMTCPPSNFPALPSTTLTLNVQPREWFRTLG